MIREGPISQTVHGAIEYAAGALFIAAPFIFDFDDDSATAVAIIVGVLIIFVAAITNGPTSLIDSLPLSVHIVLDYALAAVLIAVAVPVRLLGRDEPRRCSSSSSGSRTS